MAKTKFDNIKNRVLLVVIVFLLSYLLTALIDKEYTTWFFGGELSFVDYMIDFGVSLLISFAYSWNYLSFIAVGRFVSFHLQISRIYDCLSVLSCYSCLTT